MVWNLERGQSITQFEGSQALAFSPNGKLLVIEGTIYDMASGEVSRVLQEAEHAIEFSPNGALLAFVTWIPNDERIVLLNVASVIHNGERAVKICSANVNGRSFESAIERELSHAITDLESYDKQIGLLHLKQQLEGMLERGEITPFEYKTNLSSVQAKLLFCGTRTGVARLGFVLEKYNNAPSSIKEELASLKVEAAHVLSNMEACEADLETNPQGFLERFNAPFGELEQRYAQIEREAAKLAVQEVCHRQNCDLMLRDPCGTLCSIIRDVENVTENVREVFKEWMK